LAEIKKILFYSDSNSFGGHEIMSIKISNYLASLNEYKVEYIYHNKKIKSSLNKNIVVHFNKYTDSTPLPFIRNLNVYNIYKIKKYICKINPDIIVVCQGNIELSLKGLIASKFLNIPTISYIPYGNKFSQIGAKLSLLRDSVNKYYYSLPDYFITPNNFQKKLIFKQVDRDNTFVILNPLEVISNNSSFKFVKNEKISICIIGRIDFKHKNQIIAIEIAQKLLFKQKDFIFHIIGDGNDLEKLKSLVLQNNLSDKFIFHGWLDGNDKNKILFNDVDMVLVPSKIETGIPLVVYDALENNKKFLMSNISSIKEYRVPENFVIDINNIDLVVNKIIDMNELLNIDEYIDFKNRILESLSIDKFRNQIENTFKKIICGH